jgi:hypothetical protein
MLQIGTEKEAHSGNRLSRIPIRGGLSNAQANFFTLSLIFCLAMFVGLNVVKPNVAHAQDVQTRWDQCVTSGKIGFMLQWAPPRQLTSLITRTELIPRSRSSTRERQCHQPVWEQLGDIAAEFDFENLAPE